MEHLFLLRKQAHELEMRQLVEEITFGRPTSESAMSKYQVLTRCKYLRDRKVTIHAHRKHAPDNPLV